jgi:chromosome segregation ATPase
MKQFLDKLAEQALAKATQNLADITGKIRELERARGDLETRVTRIGEKIAALAQNSETIDGDITPENLASLAQNRADEIEQLERDKARAKQQLALFQNAGNRLMTEYTGANQCVARAQETIAAGVERAILNNKDVQKALGLLRLAAATWSAAADVQQARFDFEIWAGSILSRPTTEDVQRAAVLLHA